MLVGAYFQEGAGPYAACIARRPNSRKCMVCSGSIISEHLPRFLSDKEGAIITELFRYLIGIIKNNFKMFRRIFIGKRDGLLQIFSKYDFTVGLPGRTGNICRFQSAQFGPDGLDYIESKPVCLLSPEFLWRVYHVPIEPEDRLR